MRVLAFSKTTTKGLGLVSQWLTVVGEIAEGGGFDKLNYSISCNSSVYVRRCDRYPVTHPTQLANDHLHTLDDSPKDMAIIRPNQAWQVDITYLRHKGGFMYLVALIDVYSRYVVSWDISNTLHTNSCLDALAKGVNVNIPEIINSDQGCQFTSADWIDTLVNHGIKVSMTGKGRCHDNIYIERFWRTVKYEEFYLNDYDNVNELIVAIGNYIEFYNHKRWHQSLSYKTPAEVYRSSQREPGHMMDNASALPTSTQAQQQLLNNKGVGSSLN